MSKRQLVVSPAQFQQVREHLLRLENEGVDATIAARWVLANVCNVHFDRLPSEPIEHEFVVDWRL